MVKPILFNTEMVRAILDWRKTVTRRVVKQFVPEGARFGYTAFTPDGCISARGVFADGYGEKFYKLPYQPGDILWVRETFSPKYYWNGGDRIVYKADWDALSQDAKDLCAKPIWTPSIHMPREAARIWLRVTDVRVEQLQEMRIDDVLREGAPIANGFEDFMRLWDATIKPADRDRYGWAGNPFCWVISFERIGKDEAMQ